MATPQPDLVETAPGVAVTLAPLANDSPEGLVVVAFQQPESGTLSFDPDGQTFTYTPAAGFVGEDGFTYTVRDLDGASASASVAIRVVQPNRPPIAVDDAAAVVPGDTVDIAVLANDADPDGDPLGLSAISLPAHGSVTVLPGQQVRYAPASGFVGEDSFGYTVGDQKGGTAPASVRVLVGAANRSPEAQDDRVTTLTGQPVTIAVLANDSDPDADQLRVVALGLPAHGTVGLDAGNRVTYTPQIGFDGTDQFTYTVDDGRGGTANGTVEITVVPVNAPPLVADDTATTEAGQPVSIDMLGNDSDPEGAPLSLVRVTVPDHGRIALGADQHLVYTPDAGFLGTDSFTYTASDEHGASASATVTVTVVPPATPTTYLNGYRYRRRIVIPGRFVRGDAVITGFPLLVAEEGPWLRTVAEGGEVESGQGFDLRFELDQGGKLDHDIEHYDPLTGRLVAWVRLPELRAGADLVLFLYYGKPNLASSEADAAATWRDYLAVWHLPDPVDRTGRGRNLTSIGVTTDTGQVGPAGRFDGTTSELSLAAPEFLDGLSALTAQLWIQSDRLDSDHGLLVSGPLTGRDSDVAFVLRHNDRGAYSSAARVFTVEMALADGRIVLESSAGRAGDQMQSVALVFDRGEGAALFFDGVADTPGYSSGHTLLGPTRLGVGPLRIGSGPAQATAGRWRGLIDELRFRATALSADWLAMEHTNQRAPRTFYGIGGEDAFGDTATAPVAVPVAARTTIGTAVVLDPLASAFDPEEPGTLTLDSVGTPGNGTTAIEAGKIRYVPASGFTGEDRFTFVVAKSGKSSTGTAVVKVDTAASETSPEQDRPFADRLYGNPYHADALGHRQFLLDSPVAKRFLAERTGEVTAIRWHNRFAAGDTGYSRGDGGDVVIKIETDYEGQPSGLPLGTTAINGGGGKPTTQGEWPEWRFEQPVPLEMGKPYHLVWYQVGTSGSVSVVHHLASVPIPTGQNLHGGPYEGDSGPIRQLVPGGWQTTDLHGGFLQLSWADGAVTGNPILAGLAGLKKSFGGALMIRQRFTVTDYTRKIDGIWFRIWWEGGTPSDLLIRLETLDGTLLEQINVPRGALPQTRNVAGDASSPPAPWVYRRFTRTHTLELGRSYVVRFSASTGSYVVHAVQRGDADLHGATSRDQWLDAWAEFTVSGGSSWRGWDDSLEGSGVARTDCHLPLAFSIAGSLERLGVSTLIASSAWTISDVARLSDDAGVGDGASEARGVANGASVWSRFGFATPRSPLVGRQTFRVRARCSVAGGALKVELLENGELRKDLGTQPVGTSFATLSFLWDASLLADSTGAGVELKLSLVDSLTSGYYTIEAIDWLADPAGEQTVASELPTPVRTVPVSTASQLTAALAAARPGDHIVLADGTYSGNFTLSVAGTAPAPIVVKAATLLGATISGGVTLSSAYGQVYGLTFGSNSGIGSTTGNGVKIRRCKFQGGYTGAEAIAVEVRGSDVEVAWNEFADFQQRAVSIRTSAGARRAWVHHNWFHDWSGTPGTNVREPIQIGQGVGDETIVADCTVEYNLLDNCNVDDEAISIKSSGNTVRYNTLLNSSIASIHNRVGDGNKIHANWVEASGGIRIMDRGIECLGNKVLGSGNWQIFAGNRGPDDPIGSPPKYYPAAWNTIVAGNEGPITVGHFFSSESATMTINAKNTVIEAHTGTITYSRHESTTVSPTTARTIPTAAKLTAAQVGPNGA